MDYVLRIDERLVGAAVAFLQALCVGLRDTDSLHDVAGDVVAAVVDGAEVSNLALVEDGDVRRSRSHLDQRHAELLLIFGENAESAGQRLQHQLAHVITGALYRLAQVHRR